MSAPFPREKYSARAVGRTQVRELARLRTRNVDLDGDVGSFERLHALQLEAGADVEAARAAVGLGGRERRSHGSSERARTSVARCLRHALARIADHHAELGSHLQGAVRTGTYCSHRSDPLAPFTWLVRDAGA